MPCVYGQPPPVVESLQRVTPVVEVLALDGLGSPVPNLSVYLLSLSEVVPGFFPNIPETLSGTYGNVAVCAHGVICSMCL